MDDKRRILQQQMLDYHAGVFKDSINWMIENAHATNSVQKMYIPSAQANAFNGLNIIEASRQVAAFKTEQKFFQDLTSLGHDTAQGVPDFTDNTALRHLASSVDELIVFRNDRNQTKSIKDDFYAIFDEAIKNRDPFKLGIHKGSGRSPLHKQVNETIYGITQNWGDAETFLSDLDIQPHMVSNQAIETGIESKNPINDHALEKRRQRVKDEIERQTGNKTILSNAASKGSSTNEANRAFQEHERQKNATRRLVNSYVKLGVEIHTALGTSKEDLKGTSMKFANLALSHRMGQPMRFMYSKEDGSYISKKDVADTKEEMRKVAGKINEYSEKTGINVDERLESIRVNVAEENGKLIASFVGIGEPANYQATEDKLMDIERIVYQLNNGFETEDEREIRAAKEKKAEITHKPLPGEEVIPELHDKELKFLETLKRREFVDEKPLMDEPFLAKLSNDPSDVDGKKRVTINDFLPNAGGTPDPMDFRDGVNKLSLALNDYIAEGFADKQKYRQITDLLEHSKKNNISLAEMLLTADANAKGNEQLAKFRNYEISRIVLANLGFKRSLLELEKAKREGKDVSKMVLESLGDAPSDNVIRYQIANILDSSQHMQVRTFFKKDSWLVDPETKKDGLLSKVKMLSKDFDNPASADYADLYRAMNLRKELTYMKSELYDERKWLQNEAVTYLTDRDADGDAKEDALRNLYNDGNQVSKIYEKNEISYKRMQESIEMYEAQGKDAPRSPMTLFRNEVDQFFHEYENSTGVKQRAEDVEKELVRVAREARQNFDEATIRVKEAEKNKPKRLSQQEIDDIIANSESNALIGNTQGMDKSSLDAKRNRISYIEDAMQTLVEDETTNRLPLLSSYYKHLYTAEKMESRKNVPSPEKLTLMRRVSGRIEEKVKGDFLADSESKYAQLKAKADAMKVDLQNDEQAFKKEELAHQKATLSEKIASGWTDQDTIDNHGWKPGMPMSPEFVKRLQDSLEAAEGKDSGGFKVSVYEAKGSNLTNREKWNKAIENNSTIRVRQSKVGFKPIGMVGSDVIIKPETLLVDDIGFSIKQFTLEEYNQVIGEMDKDDVRKLQLEGSNHDIVDSIQSKDGFVELRYDNTPINKEHLAELGPYMNEKLSNVDKTLNQLYPLESGVETIVVSKDNIRENMNTYFKRIGSPEGDISNKKMLPAYIVNMLQSHAPFMVEDKDIVGNAQIALERTINDISYRGGTLDLSTEGITNRWMLTEFGKTKNLSTEELLQVAEFKSTLAQRTPVQRMQDSLFMDVLRNVHEEHFGSKGKRGGSSKKDNDFITKEIISVYNGMYPDKRSMSVDTLMEVIHSKKMDKGFELASHYGYIRHMSREDLQDQFLESINDSMKAMETPDMADSSLRVRTLEEDLKNTDIDKPENSVIGDEDLSDQRLNVQTESGAADTSRRGRIREAEVVGEFDIDSYDPIREDTFLYPDNDPQKKSLNAFAKQILYTEGDKEPGDIRLRGGVNKINDTERFIGVNNMRMALEVERKRGNDRLHGVHDFGGNLGVLPIEIFEGSQKGLLAYVPSLDKHFEIQDTIRGNESTIDADLVAPRLMNTGVHLDSKLVREHINSDEGTRTKTRMKFEQREPVGNPGRVKVDPLFTPGMQRTGAAQIGSNPSVTADEMVKFVQGKSRLIYMDIESTGLLGGTVDKKYIQPIEVHAEQIEWNPETASLRRNEQGQYTVRVDKGLDPETGERKYNEIVKNTTQYVALTDDTKAFAQQLIDEGDFSVTFEKQVYDPNTKNYVKQLRTISVLDYLGEETLVNAGRISERKLHEEILEHDRTFRGDRVDGSFASVMDQMRRKSDNLYFLRNIAKYATLGEDIKKGSERQRIFNMHAGNSPLPSIAEHIDNEGEITSEALEDVRYNQAVYLNQLFDDVDEASRRLDVNSGYGVVDTETMLNKMGTFMGKHAVIGQNVANADMRMLIHATDLQTKFVSEIKTPYDEIHSKELQSFLQAFDEKRNDILEEEVKVNLGMGMDEASLSVTGTGEDKVFRTTEDWLKSVLQNVGGKANASTRISGFSEGLTALTQLDKLVGRITGEGQPALTDDELKVLSDNGLDKAYKAVVSSSKQAQKDSQSKTQRLNALQDTRSKINQRSILDQQYISQYLNPDLDDQKAGTQATKYGIGTGAQHFAVDDVRAGIQVVEAMTKDLVGDQSFTEYMDSPNRRDVRKGDFLEMKRSVEKNPLGLYRVQDLDYENNIAEFVRVDDGSNQTIKISSTNPTDFVNKIQNGFEWIGTGGKKKQNEVIKEFENDQTRRQVLRTFDTPFNFYLSELQVDDQYKPALQNLLGVYEGATAKLDTFSKEQRDYDTAKKLASIQVAAMQDRGVPQTEIDAKVSMPVAPTMPEFTALERMTLQHKNLFGTEKVHNILNEEITPTRSKVLENTNEFMNTDVGKRYQEFFHDVDRLEKVGAISRTQSSQMIKAWNEEIKQAASERGAKRELKNNVNLGNLTFKNKTGENVLEDLRLDLSNRQSIERSLHQMVNRTKSFTPEGADDTRLNTALAEYIIPKLQQNKLLSNQYNINDPEFKTKVPALAKDIYETVKTTNPELKPFLQDDPLQYAELGKKDPSFLTGIDNLHERLIGDFKSNLTPMQSNHWMYLNDFESELKEAGMYIPHLQPKPDASQVRAFTLDSITFGRNSGRIDNASTNTLINWVNSLSKDVELRRQVPTDAVESIFNRLSYNATNGENIAGRINDIILEKGADSDQVRSMRALNWITENPLYDPNNPTDAPRYIQNPDIGSYIFGSGAGKDSMYNAKQIREIDKETLNRISMEGLSQYSGTDHRGFLRSLVLDYNEAGRPNYVGQERPVTRVLEEEPGQQRTEMAAVNDALVEEAERVKAEGRTPINEGAPNPVGDGLGGTYTENQRTPIQEGPIPQREPGVLEKWLHNRKDDVRNAGENIVEKLDLGKGGAGRWIAGLGVAAMALQMFHNAGSPIKLEDRPQGQGVASTNGRVQDDVQFGSENGGLKGSPPSPSTGGKAYVNNGQGGYTVKASGRATNNINHKDLQQQMKNTSGNVNIKMKDERSSYDRGWLENQFTTYIDRGHLE